MTERKRKLEAIFQTAVELSSLEQRELFLDHACVGEPDLRHEVEELLKAATAADVVFQPREGLLGQDWALRHQSAPEQLGSVIERYKLLEKVGEGGCGVVYVAEQVAPVRRRVALKVIKLGMDTRSVVARFEAERQALAMMDHPNIAKVLDAGATETGRPYFVMELVRGTKITEYCDQNQLSTAQRLELFLQVCRAVQHAHQKGIIHRDLKPSNILVTVNDGVAVPKVIDFGIAKATEARLTDKTVYTELHQFIGTPAYMSPEQAELTSVDIDTRSDIYSLGVLLYELLTGKTPFDQKELLKVGLDEMRKTIRTKEPPRPSTRLSTLAAADLSTVAKARRSEPPKLIHLVRGDLDWIVMKCLEKDRSRRYDTANGLAMDLQRHLNNEPILARPPSRLYEFQKTVRRHRVGFAAAVGVVTVLALGAAVSTWEAVRARRAERATQTAQVRETEARLRAQDGEYAANMKLAQQAWQQKQSWRVRQILEETANYPDLGFEWYYWQRQIHSALVTFRGHSDAVCGVAFSPDGRRVATASLDRTAKIWDAANGHVLITLQGHRGGVASLAFFPDGGRIVTGSRDRTARVWDAATGDVLFTLQGHSNGVFAVALSPDGQRIVTGSEDNTAKVWDAATRRELVTLTGHTAGIYAVAFSPNGRMIATASDDGTARVWDATTGNELSTLRPPPVFNCVAFSADSRRVVTGSDDPTAEVWDITTRKVLATLEGHSAQVRGAAFSPDGQQIATGSEDTTAILWEAATGKALRSFIGAREKLVAAEGWILSIAFSPDGRRILTGCNNGTAKLWDAARGNDPLTLSGHTGLVLSVAFAPDGRRIVTGSVDHTAKVWDSASGKVLLTIPAHDLPVRHVAFSPDGRRIATSSFDQRAKVWDAASGKELLKLEGHLGGIWAVAFSPDGQRLATGSLDKTARIWDGATGMELFHLEGHNDAVLSLAFSPDGRRIVTGGADKTARVWDAATGRSLLRLEGQNGRIYAVTFSPDNTRVVTGSEDATLWIWDAVTGRKLSALEGHSAAVLSVAFSADGRRIVTSSVDQTAKIWDAATSKELLTLSGHNVPIQAVAISPDGQRIVTASDDLTAKIWEAATSDQVRVWQKEENEAAERLQREQAITTEAERTRQAQDPGMIKDWLILAPIRFQAHSSGSNALAQEQIPGEAHLRPAVGDRSPVAEGEMSWRPFDLDDYRVDFNDLIVKGKADWALAYAVAYIDSDAAQTNLAMKIGSQDQAKVYLNGKEVYRSEARRRFIEDQDVVTGAGVQLKAGCNALVFKVVLEEVNDWRGSIRFTDAAGRPVKGIRTTLTPPFLR